MKRIYLGGSVVLGFSQENEKPSVENLRMHCFMSHEYAEHYEAPYISIFQEDNFSQGRWFWVRHILGKDLLALWVKLKSTGDDE